MLPKNRDDSYKKYKISRLENNKVKYRECRNRVVAVIREERKKFYQEKIDLEKSSPRKMWETLGQLITDRKKTKMNKIDINGEILTNSTDIAENLNKYFIDSIKIVMGGIDGNSLTGLSLVNDECSSCHRFEAFRLIDFKQLEEIVFSLPNKGSSDDLTSEFF